MTKRIAVAAIMALVVLSVAASAFASDNGQIRPSSVVVRGK